jgi:Domain of unknown function (DUF4405)
MNTKTKWNAWLDAAIFISLVLTAWTGVILWLILPEGSGSSYSLFLGVSKSAWVTVHDWAGVAMLAGLLMHVVLHWEWVVCVASRFTRRLPRQARTNFGLDAILGIVFLAVSISGLISWLAPGGGYHGGRNPAYNALVLGLSRDGWNDLHLWAGVAMISLALLHLALHWKWILCTLRNFIRQGKRAFPFRKSSEECVV